MLLSTYADAAVGLLACPFCREMFEKGEATSCPVCGMELTQFENLPPSLDALHDEGGVPTTPEMTVLPWSYVGRGKLGLVLVGIVGLVLFFLPWVKLTMPYIDSRSGFDLAHQRIGWLWAAFVAWVVLLPTVISRRTILQLRGARVASAFLCAIPAVAASILLLKPPKAGILPVRYTWEWPIWVVVAVSLIGVALSFRLGGRLDDITVTRGTSKGQALH